jgi:hypothetical protein
MVGVFGASVSGVEDCGGSGAAATAADDDIESAFVGVAEVVISATVVWADKFFSISASDTVAAFAEIVGVLDTSVSTSAIASSEEAKPVDDDNTGVVDVFVVVIAVVAAIIAFTGNSAVVLDDILIDVALAFAIGRTAFVCA